MESKIITLKLSENTSVDIKIPNLYEWLEIQDNIRELTKNKKFLTPKEEFEFLKRATDTGEFDNLKKIFLLDKEEEHELKTKYFDILDIVKKLEVDDFSKGILELSKNTNIKLEDIFELDILTLVYKINNNSKKIEKGKEVHTWLN